MIKLSLKLGVCMALLRYSTVAMEGDGLSDILETAMRTSPLAAKALGEEAEFRRVTIQQINAFREQLQDVQEEQKVESPEAWREKVLRKIQEDMEATKRLDEALSPLKAGVDVPYAVKTHKTTLILEGVKELLESSFFKFLDGTLPDGYGYDQPTVTLLGGDNQSTIWGNSRGTFLKAALAYMVANQEEGAMKGFGSILSFDDSALAHIAPLPIGFKFDAASYSFVGPYSDRNLGFIFFHSGYAFGGGRNEARYPAGKKFGPQDCSSYLGRLTGGSVYTTADQLCAFRRLASKEGLVPEGWENGDDAKCLLENYTVVTVGDPSKDIQAGQIYSLRAFREPDVTMSGLGSGGHTAVVLGFRGSNIITIGANRDMPKLEGIGIQNFSWEEEPLKMKMLFELKKAS